MTRRLLLAFALAPATVFAADRWQVMTGDFKTRPLIVERIDGKDLVVGGTDDAQRVPLSTFVQAARSAKIEAPSGMVLCLAGGDRLIGQPRALDGATLVWFVAGIGEVRVPIERALGILRDKSADPRLDAERGEDVMLLLNGDTVRGIVTAFAERSISITPTGGDAIDVPVDNIRELLMATPPQGRGERVPAGYTLRLTTGTVISCQKLSLTDDKLEITVGDTKASMPISIVASIEHTAGPVAWLSTRTPSEVAYTPYFTGDFTPKMDKTVTGEPIRLGNQLIQRGIGMHSKTRMTFPVTEGDQSFRTRYAIDSSLGYADVDVRVFVDGKLVHENKGFKAGDLSPVVDADLAGAKSLTLEVDYGQGYDIQDRLTWIEPAILRK